MKPLIPRRTIGLLLSICLGACAGLPESKPAPAAEPQSTLSLDRSLGAPTTPTIEPVAKPQAVVAVIPADKEIWSRMRRNFGMTDLTGPIVAEREKWYLARPSGLSNTLGRGGKYLYYILDELEKRGMPSELALLPLVESAYNPMALSSAKASGLWQFIPSTGRDFNLEQNWWLDERRDVIASTKAALDYLQAIYEMHGDWHLALASYNWGEGAVMRAVNKNIAAGLPTDYASLRMPDETRYYVPKLQALKNIIANADSTGIKLPNIPNQPYFTVVEKTEGIDISLAAKLAEMPQADFLNLNPAYNRPIIRSHADGQLLLPIANAARFKENLAKHQGPLVTWRTWSVPKASKIDQIARQLKVPVAELAQANGLTTSARLSAGYTLLVPIHANLTVSPDSKPNTSKVKTTKTPAKTSPEAKAKQPADSGKG